MRGRDARIAWGAILAALALVVLVACGRGERPRFIPPPPPTPPPLVAPAPVVADPTRSLEDRFSFRWAGGGPGASGYEYAVDCDPSRLQRIGATAVTLSGAAGQRGPHAFCVRAVGAAGARGPWGSTPFTYAKFPTEIVQWTWAPSPVTLGAVSRTQAQLRYRDASGRALPLAGRLVRFTAGPQPVGPTTTDTGGLAAAAAAIRSGPGTLSTTSAFSGDADFEPASATGTLVVIVDTTPPTVPIVSVTPALSAVNAFTASWPASTDAESGVRRYRYRIDGGAEQITGGTSVGGPLAPAQGVHVIEVLAEDNAGNRSAWGARATFEWRRVATALAFVEEPAATVERCATRVFGVTLREAGGAQAALSGRTVSATMGSIFASTATDGTGVARFTIQVDLPPGRYDLVVRYGGDAGLDPSEVRRSVTVTGDADRQCVLTAPIQGDRERGSAEPTSQGRLSVDIPPR